MKSEKITEIIDKFRDEDLQNKIDLSILNKKIISDLDVLQWFNITILELIELKEAAKSNYLDEILIKKSILIIQKIDRIIKIIPKINDKVIKDGKEINKNTMAYLLKVEKEQFDNTVVLNISVDEKGNNIRLMDLLPEIVFDDKNKKIK